MKRKTCNNGFTLIELLVVIFVFSMLTGILLPVLNKAGNQARKILGASNQRQIVSAATLFSADNDQRYPESVATLGDDLLGWNWGEPTILTCYNARNARLYRSMSTYLHNYIEDASTMYCPNAPRKYKYLQEAWDAGEDWDNPQTPLEKDAFKGTYCFYWNYIGYLQDRWYPFKGPRNAAGGAWQSKLLVSDYFGYDHFRNPNSYGSCEKFPGASITEGTLLSSPYWSDKNCNKQGAPDIKLTAGYTDGHVESYSSSDTVVMRVIKEPQTNEPYPYGDGTGPGFFYLPRKALD
ncbi:MAG: type II secretion system protein [Sedimentisphaerales bacterium]|nr:type II secretion system protein [Sedimentisphaerales bacterium]